MSFEALVTDIEPDLYSPPVHITYMWCRYVRGGMSQVAEKALIVRLTGHTGRVGVVYENPRDPEGASRIYAGDSGTFLRSIRGEFREYYDHHNSGHFGVGGGVLNADQITLFASRAPHLFSPLEWEVLMHRRYQLQNISFKFYHVLNNPRDRTDARQTALTI